jgi:hypothetical protein
MMIDPGTAEKLEKLIKMLSSDHDGEVVAAARAITRTLNGAGTWFGGAHAASRARSRATGCLRST